MDVMLYRIIDDYLPELEHKEIWNYCNFTQYNLAEADTEETHQKIVSGLDIRNLSNFPRTLEGEELSTAHINYYVPNEHSSFHQDSDRSEALTLIYFPCPTYDINEGGATELIINDEIVGVRSKANRALIFKSVLWHRATPFHTKQRFTVALKYGS